MHGDADDARRRPRNGSVHCGPLPAGVRADVRGPATVVPGRTRRPTRDDRGRGVCCADMRAIRATAPGGPEVLSLDDLPDPTAGPGELLVQVAAAGVNFIDTYRRSGIYQVPFPHVVGSEGAGTVVSVGEDANGFVPGDRVAWSAAPGSYAELAVVRADDAVPVPDGVGDDVAAALLLQGMTAHYLVTSTFPVQPHQVVLLHAGAGGVGLLLTQLAVARGAR